MSDKTNWRRLSSRLQLWGRRVGLARKLAVLLTLAAVGVGIATYIVLTGSGPLGPDPTAVLILLNINLVLLLLLGALVARRLVRVWAQRRQGSVGARLHVRLVMLFSVVAITPAILVAVFSAALINFGVEQWFNKRVSTAIDESMVVAKAYLGEHQQAIGGDAIAMANDINREGPSLLRNPPYLAQLVGSQAAIRGLSEALIFDNTGNVLARSGLAFSMELSINRIPRWAFDRARNGDAAVLTNAGDERVRALVKLDGSLGETFLFVGRFVDPKVLEHVERTSKAAAEYQRLEGTRSGLEITFSAIYAVVALLLLLAAVWIGLSLANQLATPIVRLIDAAERVRGGDLTARVDQDGSADELGLLTRAFNRMTIQLSTQRSELIETNRELDERRRFTETVLSGVSAGVIGLDRNGLVELPNRSAADLLAQDSASMIGRPLAEVVPEMADLFEAVRRRPERSGQEEMQLHRDGRSRVLLVRIVAEQKNLEQQESEVTGYVVTFDDITELLSAQRKAAWADVARRIAHEIKNPLTPIQLSAERLKRKYLKEIQSDKDTFVSCTDTIIRQVGDIGRMVDEFSSFARMPAPVIKDEDLLDVVRQSVFLARNGYPEISFETQLPASTLHLSMDTRLIGQAMTNLLKNAVESIQGREGTDLPQGHIVVSVEAFDQAIAVRIEDNGKGLPVEQRDRLTEPYVTTRAKGTGLGLAIVKKIMEDHGGELMLEDVVGTGARISLIFPMEEKGNSHGA